MRNYELTIVLDGKVTAAKKKSEIEKVEKNVAELRGKAGKPRELGVKDLAYKIKKSTTGMYIVFPLELSGEGAKELAGKLRLDEELIRYLIVRKD